MRTCCNPIHITIFHKHRYIHPPNMKEIVRKMLTCRGRTKKFVCVEYMYNYNM